MHKMQVYRAGSTGSIAAHKVHHSMTPAYAWSALRTYQISCLQLGFLHVMYIVNDDNCLACQESS